MLAFPAKVLLVIHATSAIVLLGSTTHLAVLGVLELRGRAVRKRLQHVYRRVITWAYPITFGLGLILYPTFRVQVRAGYLDANVPLAVGFFEVKEHWLALGLLVVWVLRVLDRPLEGPPGGPPRAWLASWMAVALAVMVWLAFFTGLSLGAVRPV